MDGKSLLIKRMVKRTMNGKRLLLLGAFAAFASFAVPAAYANTLSNTGTITVKWNTQAIGSLVLHTNYDPATGLNNAAGNVVLTNNNGGVGTCAAAGGGNVDGTVDFGYVSLPTSRTSRTVSSSTPSTRSSRPPTRPATSSASSPTRLSPVATTSAFSRTARGPTTRRCRRPVSPVRTHSRLALHASAVPRRTSS